MGASIDLITPDVIALAEDLLAFKMYFVGCFTLLFFDFFLTLGDEVECIWKGKKTPMFYIFLMNRYCPMAFCIITLFAYFSLLWNLEVSPVCNRFAIVEWLQTLLIVIPAEIVLLLRVFALTNKNKYLFGFLVSIMLTECIIVFYAMSLPGTNDALPLPHVPIDSFHVCILYSDPAMDTAYLSTSILFDCIVFAITIACTINNSTSVRRPRSSSILQTIRWDGTLYFCVILSGNVVWMALAINARPGLKLMNAQPSMYITSIMINRLSLSVRKVAAEATSHNTSIEWPSGMFSPAAPNTALPTFA